MAEEPSGSPFFKASAIAAPKMYGGDPIPGDPKVILTGFAYTFDPINRMNATNEKTAIMNKTCLDSLLIVSVSFLRLFTFQKKHYHAIGMGRARLAVTLMASLGQSSSQRKQLIQSKG